MVLRAVLSFLVLAAVWTFGIPDRVETSTPEALGRHAGRATLPEPFEPTERPRAQGIDPEPQRVWIDPIEAVLYRRGPSDVGDAAAVESAAIRLADSILHTAGLRGREASLRVLGFARVVRARTEAGDSRPSLVAMRSDWEAVRSVVFRPASWMHRAGADLDRIQDPPPPAPDPRTDTVIAATERDLRRLLAYGEHEAELLGEPRYPSDAPGARGQGQILAWQRFGERWHRQIAEATAPVRSLAPPPHPDRQPLRAEAVRALVEAQEMLRRVPDGAGAWPTPSRRAWKARLRAAGDALARARRLMARTAPLDAPPGPAASDGSPAATAADGSPAKGPADGRRAAMLGRP